MINVAGGHMGRDKTYEKVASRFYWDALDRDVREYVQHCDVCQRTNDAKFNKGNAALHPIKLNPRCGSR